MDNNTFARPGMHPAVWLVGAGPGDPELLTLKAVRILAQADVVLVDDLVGTGVLHYCPQARIIHVGKRGGCRSTPQSFIQRLMLRYARQGLTVIRLKGGDPGVFGRSGEEIEWLARHGIACGIVNGITAGLAAATACNIPLTLRGIARGVSLVTAHTDDDSPPPWEALARSGTTLVVYMGVTRLDDISRQLQECGLPGHTPVCMVENASLPYQRQFNSTLLDMPADGQAAGLRSPAILIIGSVATQTGTQATSCSEYRSCMMPCSQEA